MAWFNARFKASLFAAAMIALSGGCARSAPATTRPQAPSIASPLELEGRGKTQRDKYNAIYADPTAHSTEPNAFMLACLDRIEQTNVRDGIGKTSDAKPPRTALDIAMGEGRNTIALAQRGYRATGFDMSDVGVNKARQRAADLKLDIDAQVITFKDFQFGIEQWDVVVMMYFSADDSGMKLIADSVKPRGYIIIERSGGDINNDYLRQLPSAEWEFIFYEQSHGPRDWASGQGHAPDGPRTQVLARKR